LSFFKWLHSLQAQPTTKRDYKKTAIMVKYLVFSHEKAIINK